MERNIKLLALFNFFTDFKFHSAVLILYFSHVTGSYTLGMSLFSVVMISSALFEVPTGIFSDLIGRKKTVMLGALSATISAVFYAVGGSYWPLFIGALLEGLSRSWYSGNNDALLYDSLTQSGNKEKFAHYLGKTSSMFQMALMIGAVVGSILAQWSFSLIMWLSVIPQIVCLIISFFLQNPQKSTNDQTNIFSHLKISAFHIWNNKRLKLLSIQDILSFGIGESSFHFNAAFIGTLWPIWAIGFSRMISYGGAFLSYWFSGKLIRKMGEYNILIIANIYTRIANFIAYGYATVFSPVLMASSSIFYGATQVSINALMQKEYTQEQRATLASLNSFFGSMFYGIFSPILGLVADLYSPAMALIMVQFCMFSVLYINFKLKFMKEHHQ
jgi:MFS family permease